MDLFERLKGHLVLLVEDDPHIRDSFELLFAMYDIALTLCPSGEDGVVALEKQAYDIVIVDYRMPRMDGITFLAETRRLRPDAFRIFMTAHGNATVFEQARSAGAHQCLEKPITLERLESSLSFMMSPVPQLSTATVPPLSSPLMSTIVDPGASNL